MWFLVIFSVLFLVVYCLRSSRSFMAYAITNMAAACSKCIHKQKELLFEPLTEDAAKMGKHKLQVLELGGGAGSNFGHVKSPVSWTVTEPNKGFAPYFDKTVKEKGGEHRISELKEAVGEDLGQFAPEYFDAVVVSKVLCSVTDVQKVLKEILRVLKKGGKFYFVEHVAGKRGTWLRFNQNFLQKSGFWPFLFGNCCVNRDTEEKVRAAGFDKVEVVKFDVNKMVMYPCIKFIYGWATK